MILLSSNHPFAQGVFTAIIIGILLFIFRFIGNGVDKTIDKAYLSSNDVNKLLHFAFSFFKKGKIDEAIQSYKKVLQLDPINWNALVSLGFINFSKNNFDESKKLYEKLYQQYFLIDPRAKYRLEEKQLALIYASLYRLGFILHNEGDNNKALELKTLSLTNKYFVDNYKKLRNENLY